MFMLHLIESWYKVILGKPITPELIKNVNVQYNKFATRFKALERFDANVFDEGSTALDSKDAMTKLSKDLSKMYDVMRVKGIFSIIVLPSFFNLNKYFRENRLRGVVWINKRGEYKYYTKQGIQFLNVYNANKPIKNMNLAKPVHHYRFSDYKGVLREEYDKIKTVGVDKIIDEVSKRYEFEAFKPKSTQELLYEPVKAKLKQGLPVALIARDLNTSPFVVTQIKQRVRAAEQDD
jgi:hypothetical protein